MTAEVDGVESISGDVPMRSMKRFLPRWGVVAKYQQSHRHSLMSTNMTIPRGSLRE